MKTRREILQGMIVSIGGSSLLAACEGVARITPNPNDSPQFYNPRELALVTKISDLIIPRTDTPGATDVNVSGFLDSLMTEWANTDTQQSHHRAIGVIGDQLGWTFLGLDRKSAEDELTSLDARAYTGRPREFSAYRSLKGLITQAYFASEAGKLLEQEWVAVPGRWDPSVEI